MAYISNHDAQILWNNTQERSWTGLYRAVVENRNNEDLQMGYNEMDDIARATTRLNNMKMDFPGTAGELTELLNQELRG